MFQTRYSRYDSKNRVNAIKTGRRCTVLVNGVECAAIVLDLHIHLIRIHGLTFSNDDYKKAMAYCETFQRSVFFRESKHKSNPLYKFDRGCKIALTSKLMCDLKEIVPNPKLDEVSSQDDHSSGDENTFIPNNISNTVSQKISESFFSFRDYSLTISGGSRSLPNAKMDFSNLLIIFNAVGENKFFDPRKLNHFITKELELGKSPSTLHSRLLSLTRYIHFLKIHSPILLPKTKNIDRFVSVINGVQISLCKQRKRRQQFIMAHSREKYPDTIKVLNNWRISRKTDNYLFLFEKHSSNPLLSLSQDEYFLMRDYLITELIIPNGQRPGIICGMLIKEVENATNDVTEEGFHKLIVVNHKTGHIQNATLFFYPEIFKAANIFIHHILPKLPIYLSKSRALSNDSPVFQSYVGDSVLSSRVTPILRHFLTQMGINFQGTITDLRKAAATLTGKYDPNLHELMAIFLGHSRRTHDRYYRIHVGHNGLTEAFKSLERFQSNPDAQKDDPSTIDSTTQSNSHLTLSNSLSPNFPIHSNVDINDSDENVDYNHSNIGSLDSNQSVNCMTSIYCNSSSISNVRTSTPVRKDSFSSSFLDASGQIHLENLPPTVEYSNVFLPDPNPSNSITRESIARESILNEISPARSSSTSPVLIQSVINANTSNLQRLTLLNTDKKLNLKSLKIYYDPNISSLIKKSREVQKAHPKSILTSQKDETIFRAVFLEQINRVANRRPVTSREIIELCKPE